MTDVQAAQMQLDLAMHDSACRQKSCLEEFSASPATICRKSICLRALSWHLKSRKNKGCSSVVASCMADSSQQAASQRRKVLTTWGFFSNAIIHNADMKRRLQRTCPLFLRRIRAFTSPRRSAESSTA